MALAAVTAWGLHTQRQDIKRQQRELADQQEQLNEQRELTRRQTELITRQLQAAKLDQARQVTAWVKTTNWHSGESDAVLQGGKYAVFVNNGSDQPIYDVTCAWLPETDKGDGQNLVKPAFAGVLVPTANAELVRPLHDSEGRSMRLVPVMRPTDTLLIFPFDFAPPGVVRFRATFTDAADVHWQLDEHDRLTEIPKRTGVVAQRGAAEGG